MKLEYCKTLRLLREELSKPNDISTLQHEWLPESKPGTDGVPLPISGVGRFIGDETEIVWYKAIAESIGFVLDRLSELPWHPIGLIEIVSIMHVTASVRPSPVVRHTKTDNGYRFAHDLRFTTIAFTEDLLEPENRINLSDDSEIPQSASKYASVVVALFGELTGPYAFRFDGNHWELEFGKEKARFVDEKGFRHIHHLLYKPQHVLEAEEIDGRQTFSHITAKTIEPEGFDDMKKAYRRIEAQLSEETDEEEILRLESEKEKIIDYFRKNTNKFGKDKFFATSPEPEKARKRVRAAINRAIDKIHAKMPDLGEHLNTSINGVGTGFRYDPAPVLNWQL